MMTVLLISFALLMRVAHAYYIKKTSGVLKDFSRVAVFNGLQYFICIFFAVGLILLSRVSFHADLKTVLIAALGGTCLALCGVYNFLALEEGSVVLVNMAGTAGMLVPCVAGCFLFGETFSLLQLVGVGLLGVAIWLLFGYNVSMKGKVGIKGILLLTAVFLTDGLTMLAQKMFTYYVPAGSVAVYSFWSFFFSAFVLGTILLVRGKRSRRESLTLPPGTAFPMLCLAVAIFSVNQVVTEVSAYLPSLLLFPLFNGLAIILITLTSALLFKEKLTVKSVSGIFLGILAIVMINSF